MHLNKDGTVHADWNSTSALLTSLFLEASRDPSTMIDALPRRSFLRFDAVHDWLNSLLLDYKNQLKVAGSECRKTLDDVSLSRAPDGIWDAISVLDGFLSLVLNQRLLYRSARLLTEVNSHIALFIEVALAQEKRLTSAKLCVRRCPSVKKMEGFVRKLHPKFELCIAPITFEHGNARSCPRQRTNDTSKVVTIDRISTFFANKQSITDKLVTIGETTACDSITEAGITLDWRTAERIYGAILQNSSARWVGIGRRTHPRVGPILHVLPHLIECPLPYSPLGYLTDKIRQIKACGFRSLLLGCVDRQSVSVYYGEKESGSFARHVNSHGYWISGAIGINPLLGSEADYKKLVREANEEGLGVIQDYVLGTLGYPAQLPEFAEEALNDPLSCLVIGSCEVDVTDHHFFLHYPVIPNEDVPSECFDSKQYADVVTRAHIDAPFALPKLNLYRPEVFQEALRRARWQIATAGTSCFRLDMAKHVGIRQLSNSIAELRREVASHQRAGVGICDRFAVFLEYWSVEYRDLRFASDALEEQNANVYFFDFPLARAIQNILFRHMSYVDEVERILAERARWLVHPHQLVPVVVDHDFDFRPIYNGTERTRNMVIFGYALAIMLSTNCPYVYFGVFDRRNGVPNVKEYLAPNEVQHAGLRSRNATEDIFALNDAMSPIQPLLKLFRLSHDEICADDFPVDSICAYGDPNLVIVSRSGVKNGTRYRIEARFSRFRQTEIKETGAAVMFSHNMEPSVVITSYEW